MVWMHSWLSEVKVDYATPGLIQGDNRGAIALTKNTKDHGVERRVLKDIILAGRVER